MQTSRSPVIPGGKINLALHTHSIDGFWDDMHSVLPHCQDRYLIGLCASIGRRLKVVGQLLRSVVWIRERKLNMFDKGRWLTIIHRRPTIMRRQLMLTYPQFHRPWNQPILSCKNGRVRTGLISRKIAANTFLGLTLSCPFP